MIAVNSLSFSYGADDPIFRDFTWPVERGASRAILGPSGSGKTTLLMLLAGHQQPTAGAILIDDQPVTRPRPETGVILQGHGLLPWATVWQNARLGVRIRTFYGPDGRHAPAGTQVAPASDAGVERWLRRLGLWHLRDKYPAQLSGGQRQRAAIARTLVLEPDLLLMDEPFSALDTPTRADLQDLIMDLQSEEGFTSIIVTHAIDEAALLGQSILVLDNPPIHEPVIVANPGAGRPSFRASDGYAAVCASLRERIGEVVP